MCIVVDHALRTAWCTWEYTSNGLLWICGRRLRARLRLPTNMVYVGIYVKRIAVDLRETLESKAEIFHKHGVRGNTRQTDCSGFAGDAGEQC